MSVSGISFLRPVGQVMPSGLSNAKASRDAIEFAGLDDFTIFNPYIHYYAAPPPSGSTSSTDLPVTIDYKVDYTR